VLYNFELVTLEPNGFCDFCLQENAGEEMSPVPSSDLVDPMDQNTNSVVHRIDSAVQYVDSMDQC